MSWKKHQTRSFRKLITIQEWADYTGMTGSAVLKELKGYKQDHEYDSRDIYSTFNFLLYLLITDIGLKNDNRIPIYTWLVSIGKGLLREHKK